MQNPLGLNGFYFVEYVSPAPEKLADLFKRLGFIKYGQHQFKNIRWFKQKNINFFINQMPDSHGHIFSSLHGPSASSMAFRVTDAQKAHDKLLARGAENYNKNNKLFDAPAIMGIGGSLIYLVDSDIEHRISQEFLINSHEIFFDKGLMELDHLTHNVYKGNLNKWAEFYTKLFDFKEIRYFDIKGKKTGLISRAMASPCGKIRIPLNESIDEKSQIEEYLAEYKGEGIQHIAMSSNNIYDSVDGLMKNDIKFLSTPDTYYELLDKRLPHHGENLENMRKLKILIDGDTSLPQKPLLLQIFTKNMVGPIFFEIIQRKGHDGFGEGNFQALFEAIELDQMRRGVL